MLTIARRLLPLLLTLLCLTACSTDDGPTDTSDTSESDTARSDAEEDTAPEDTQGDVYCNRELVCCNDEGQYVTSVISCDFSETCPDDTSSSTCSTEAQCYDAENPKPDCVDDNGDPVEPECFAIETISRWECPAGAGTGDAGGDAERDGGF